MDFLAGTLDPYVMIRRLSTMLAARNIVFREALEEVMRDESAPVGTWSDPGFLGAPGGGDPITDAQASLSLAVRAAIEVFIKTDGAYGRSGFHRQHRDCD